MKHNPAFFIVALIFVSLAMPVFAFASCPKGSIQMTLPDGSEETHEHAIDCCDGSKSCQSCRDTKSFTDWTTETYPQCETGKCKMKLICPPRFVYKDDVKKHS